MKEELGNQSTTKIKCTSGNAQDNPPRLIIPNVIIASSIVLKYNQSVETTQDRPIKLYIMHWLAYKIIYIAYSRNL